MKNYIICDNDADGLVSAAVVTNSMSSVNFTCITVSHRKMNGSSVLDPILEDIKQNGAERVIILDMAPSPEAMEVIVANSEHIIWNDHHSENIAKLEKYQDLPGIRADRSPATCVLTYTWCYGIQDVERMPRLVQLVHYNDIGEFNRIDVTAFKSYVYHTNPEIRDYIGMLANDVDFELGIGKRIMHAARSKEAAILRRHGFYGRYWNKRLMCINGYASPRVFETCNDSTVDAFMSYIQTDPGRISVALFRPPWLIDTDIRELFPVPKFVGAPGKCSAVVRSLFVANNGDITMK